MGYLVTIVLVTLLAYLAGLLSFKVKSRWCATCGTVKSCPRCAGWVGGVVAQGPSGEVTTDGGLDPRHGHRLPTRSR